jgi:uncharacterized protein YndB with AHSA1/START domain
MMNMGTLKVTTPSGREIAMTRVFDAPRRLVFDALTRPELVKQWLLGPPGWTMPVCEIDLRVGGAYRYVWERISDGSKMGVRGIYREVAPPERLVFTEVFDEAWYPGESVITSSLTEQGGKTTLVNTILYVSQEARDGVLKSGMQRGVVASYDRLEQLLTAPEAPGRTKGAGQP